MKIKPIVLLSRTKVHKTCINKTFLEQHTCIRYASFIRKMGKVNKANFCSLPEIAAQIAMNRFYSQIITDTMMVLLLETSGYTSSLHHKWT